MTSSFQVVYLDGADAEVVDALVAEHGTSLLAIANRNGRSGRSEQAFLPCDGHMLAAITRRHAENLGLQISESAQYAILGMPADCKTAKSIRDHVDADPNSVKVDVDDCD